jgi:hypothetical protein
MNKRSTKESRLMTVGSGLLLICIAVLGACSPRIPVIPPVTLEIETATELCVDEGTGAEMSYIEAVRLAQQSTCAQEGGLTEARACNPGTGTWWIDMDIERPGCEPACVIDVNTRTAEVNWRCTGLVTPDEDTPSVTPEADAVEEPTPTADAPTATVPAPDTPADAPTLEPDIQWARYTNDEYGFTFHYPLSWSIELLVNRPETDNRARAVRLTRDNIHLLVEYKQPDESVMIGPDDLPEGEIIEQGTITLLGRVLPKYVLEQEGRELAIFVGEQYVDLDLYIEMRVGGEDIETAEIPEEAQADFDRIIATFVRTGTAATDPYPGWATYTRPGHATSSGFAFRYPDDWSLHETETTENGSMALELRKDTLLLQIEFRSGDGETAPESSDTASESVTEAGTVSFLGTTYPRYVEVEEGRLKKIFLNHQDDTLQIHITLTGDPDQIPYAEIDLAESARQTMDQILTSFTLNAN